MLLLANWTSSLPRSLGTALSMNRPTRRTSKFIFGRHRKLLLIGMVPVDPAGRVHVTAISDRGLPHPKFKTGKRMEFR